MGHGEGCGLRVKKNVGNVGKKNIFVRRFPFFVSVGSKNKIRKMSKMSRPPAGSLVKLVRDFLGFATVGKKRN
jgi:hypothetical protein